MRRLILVLLFCCLCGVAGAAITEYYVTAETESTEWADAVNEASPCTLTTAFANADAGDRVNVKKGAYSLSGFITPGNNGDGNAFIIYRGYNATIGDLDVTERPSKWALIDTTNFPVFTMTGWIASPARYRFQNLKMTTNVNGPAIYNAAVSVIDNCVLLNTGTGANARAFTANGNNLIINSDFAITGASGGSAAVALSLGETIDGCIIYDSQAVGIVITSGVIMSTIRDTIIYGVSGSGIKFVDSTATRSFNIKSVTIYNCGSHGIEISDYAFTYLSSIVDCIITDCGGWGIYAPNATGHPLWIHNNYFRNNTSGNISANGDTDFDVGNIIGSGTNPEVDFVSPVNTPVNYTLLDTSDAAWSALNGGDIGALQHVPPTCAPTEECPTCVPTETPVNTPTETATMTETPTMTETETPTQTETMTPEPTWTPLPTYTPEPTYTPGAGTGGYMPRARVHGD